MKIANLMGKDQRDEQQEIFDPLMGAKRLEERLARSGNGEDPVRRTDGLRFFQHTGPARDNVSTACRFPNGQIRLRITDVIKIPFSEAPFQFSQFGRALEIGTAAAGDHFIEQCQMRATASAVLRCDAVASTIFRPAAFSAKTFEHILSVRQMRDVEFHAISQLFLEMGLPTSNPDGNRKQASPGACAPGP